MTSRTRLEVPAGLAILCLTLMAVAARSDVEVLSERFLRLSLALVLIGASAMPFGLSLGRRDLTRRQRWAALAQAVGGGLAGWATLQARLLGADLGSAALLLGVMLFLYGTIRGIAPSRAPTE
jgi:drug/metabolite transporter (DMT)-like permease